MPAHQQPAAGTPDVWLCTMHARNTRQAKRVSTTMWWKNCKMKIIIVILVLVRRRQGPSHDRRRDVACVESV